METEVRKHHLLVSDCRVCSLLEGKPVAHNGDRIHVEALATPISTLISTHLKQVA